jgi:hypothetical protein
VHCEQLMECGNSEGKIARVYTGVNPAVHSEEVLKDLTVLKKS